MRWKVGIGCRESRKIVKWNTPKQAASGWELPHCRPQADGDTNLGADQLMDHLRCSTDGFLGTDDGGIGAG